MKYHESWLKNVLLYEKWKESPMLQETILVEYRKLIKAFKELFNETMAIILLADAWDNMSATEAIFIVLVAAVNLFVSSIFHHRVILFFTKAPQFFVTSYQE